MEQENHFQGAWRCFPARRFQEARPHGDDAGRAWIFGDPASEKIGVGLERPTYFITIHPLVNGMVWDYRLGMDFKTGADVMSCRFGDRAYMRSAQYSMDRRALYIRLKAADGVRVRPPHDPEYLTEDGFEFFTETVNGFLRCLTPCSWVDGALCTQGEAVLALALGRDARTRIQAEPAESAAVPSISLWLGHPEDFSASNERMSLDAAQNRGLDALLCRFFLYHSRTSPLCPVRPPECECEKLAAQAFHMAETGQAQAAYSALVRLCRGHLNDGLYLESGDVRGLNGDAASESSRQLPGATSIMAAALRLMLIACAGDAVSLLPALPQSWATGRLGNLPLNAKLNLEYMEWSLPGHWVDIKIRALESTTFALRFPSALAGENPSDDTIKIRISKDERVRRFVRLPKWGG